MAFLYITCCTCFCCFLFFFLSLFLRVSSFHTLSQCLAQLRLLNILSECNHEFTMICVSCFKEMLPIFCQARNVNSIRITFKQLRNLISHIFELISCKNFFLICMQNSTENQLQQYKLEDQEFAENTTKEIALKKKKAKGKN